MSAPPIGITSRTPSTHASAVRSQKDAAPVGSSTSHAPRPRQSATSSRLIACRPFPRAARGLSPCARGFLLPRLSGNGGAVDRASARETGRFRRLNRLLDLPERAPRFTLLAFAVPTVVLAIFAAQFRVDSAPDQLLPRNDPDRSFYDGVQATFGSEEIGVVALFADDVFRPETLERIAALDEEISRIEGVHDVTSLATLETIELGDAGLTRRRILPPPPHSREQAEALRREAIEHPIGRRTVVAADGRATALLIEFEVMDDREFLRRGIDRQVREAVARHPGPEEVAITGFPTIKVNAAGLLLDDLLLFVPLGVVVIVLVLAWTFRTWLGILLPLSTVILGLVWTTGLVAWSGGAYTLGTVIVPPLLLCVGIAYSIHILSRFYLELAAEARPADAVVKALARVRAPVILAGITTLAGFASFLQSPIPSIHDVGSYGGFGILVILTCALAVIPAGLTLMTRVSVRPSAPWRDDWAARAVRRTGPFAIAHRRSILFVSALVTAASLWGISHVRVETDYIRFFSPSHPVRAENSRVSDALAGTQVIVLVADGDGAESATRLPVIDALRDLQAFADREPMVDRTVSLLDHFYMLRRAIEPELAAEPIENQQKLDQLFLLLNPEEIDATVNPDHSRLSLTAYTRLSSSHEVREFVRRAEDFARARFPPGVRVHATSTVVLLNRSADTVASGQTKALYQVFLVLLVLMVLVFRSIRLALLSLVPNVLPVLVLFGMMGAFGVDLNISTSLIGCIAIGIAIDDTIHYLSTFTDRLHEGADRTTALLDTVDQVGRPIVITSVALAAGFLVVCLSNFRPIRQFGALASISMVIALLADLFLLPALLLTFRHAADRHDASRPDASRG